MKMIENYLDNLERYLPEELKQDVRDELTASLTEQIEDSQEKLGRDLTIEETETILKKIGHPMRVASAYLPNQRLIGNEFFPAYKKALEIALAVILLIILTVAALNFISNPSQPIIKVGIIIFANFVDKGLYVFAIVTLIFYLMEYYQTNPDSIYAWSPKDLRSHSKRLALSRFETGVELIASTLFIMWWNEVLTFPAKSSIDGEFVGISLSSEWQSVFWSVNVVMGLSIALSLYKFILATWNRLSLAAEIMVSLASIAIIIQIFQFNHFVVYQSTQTADTTWGRVAANLDNVVLVSLIIVAGFCLWDIVSNLRKLKIK